MAKVLYAIRTAAFVYRKARNEDPMKLIDKTPRAILMPKATEEYGAEGEKITSGEHEMSQKEG
jgi:hypothetical protein